MSKGPSKVEGGLRATGEGRVQDNNTIQLGSISIVIWEGGESKKLTIGEADVVSVLAIERREEGCPHPTV